MELGKTSLFRNVTVKEYQDCKLLSFGKSATKELKPDISNVATVSESNVFASVAIVSIIYVWQFKGVW